MRTSSYSFALLLFACTSCDYAPPRPPIGESANQELRKFKKEVEATKPKGPASDQLVVETSEQPADITITNAEWWDAYYLGREHVGYSHTSIKPVGGDSDTHVTYTIEDQLRVRRGKQILKQWLHQSSLETIGGQFVEFQAEINRGGSVTFTTGEVSRSGLDVVHHRANEKKKHTVPWKPQFRGLFAIQQSLHSKPMTAGEERKIQCILPMQYVVGTVTLKAIDLSKVALLEGESRELLEIENTVTTDGRIVMKSVIWIDEKGQIWKTYTPAVDLASFRTSKAQATKDSTPQTDLLAATAIVPQGAQPWNSGKPDAVKFRITHKFQNPLDLFPSFPQQMVDSIDDRTVDVTCIQLGSRDSIEPTEGDTEPNGLIQSDAPSILQIRETQILSADSSAQKKASILCRFVRDYVQNKNFSRGFLSAAEVARDAEGDCTEHSVLLAALLRSVDIPSRVAAGLVHIPGNGNSPGRLAYHMWTLAWTGDGWEAFDATIGIERGVDRITIVTSNLQDGNEFRCLLPVLQVIGQIQVEVIE